MKNQSTWNHKKVTCPAIASTPPTFIAVPSNSNFIDKYAAKINPNIDSNHLSKTDVSSSAINANYLFAALASNSQFANNGAGNVFNNFNTFVNAADLSLLAANSQGNNNIGGLNGIGSFDRFSNQGSPFIGSPLNNPNNCDSSPSTSLLTQSVLGRQVVPTSCDQATLAANNFLLSTFSANSPKLFNHQITEDTASTLSAALTSHNSAFSNISSPLSSTSVTNHLSCGPGSNYSINGDISSNHLNPQFNSSLSALHQSQNTNNHTNNHHQNSPTNRELATSTASMAARLAGNNILSPKSFNISNNHHNQITFDANLTGPLTTSATTFGELFYMHGFLSHLNPQILRSHMSTSQFKPIPNNERVDLDGFRIKEPIRWSCDDVVAWMLHVARRNSIPFEEINMQGFTACNGQALMSMNEQHFKERDEIYGALVYKEFCKNVAEAAKGTVVEDLIRTLKEPERETTSIADKTPNSFLSEAAASLNYNMGLNGSTNDMRPKSQNSINSLIASSSNMFNNVGQQNCNMSQMNFQHNLQNSASLNALNSLNNRNVLSQSNIPLINNIDNNRAYAHQQQHRILQHGEALLGCGTTSSLNNNLKSSVMGPSSSGLMQNNREDIEDRSIALSGQSGVNDGNGANNFLKKEVKPRKRSQHTKGNKLWEFIRDALKDPTTNPSIVKWEDSNQGVFRIVESEKLAKMWGDKKNNQKMTYEKLSRAMRTYYEKKILEPVPKTGLYPKKLVYKFGVGSFGWKGELMTGILKRKY